MFETFQLNSGLILNDFDPDNPVISENSIVCATSGGVTVLLEPTYSDFGEDVNGVKGGSMEMKRVSGWSSSMSFTALNVSENVLKVAIGAADIVSANGFVRPRMKLKATDFRDIWWCGERSDGTVVAVCIRNALSTSGLSLETTKSGKGRLSVTLSGHASIKDQYKVPMDFYSAEDVSIEDGGGEEDTPGGSGVRAYLYNGVKLPDINGVYTQELQKTYPYAVIVKARSNYLSKDEGLDANYDGSEYELVITDKPLAFSESEGTIWYNINDNTYDTATTGMYSYLKKDGETVVPPVWNNTNNTFYSVSGIPVWSNYTLTNETDLTLPAPSDPVPLYSYHGVELPKLPELPEGYYCAYIGFSTINNGYTLRYTNVPLSSRKSADGDKEVTGLDFYPIGTKWQVYSYFFRNSIWDEKYYYLVNPTTGVTDDTPWLIPSEETYPIWVDYDILNEDGTIYLASSDPQPVYM